MKKPTICRHPRILYRIIAMILFLAALASMVQLPLTATEDGTGNAEYEAKKQAYREKLMADDVTTDDLLIGSWVSFYSFDIDSYEYQLDQMAAAGINFNILPKHFISGALFDAAYWDDVEAQYAKRNMVYLMNGGMTETNIPIAVEYAAGKEHCIGYYLRDEPGIDEFPAIADLVHSYRDADPDRWPWVNLYPGYATRELLGGKYEKHVAKFVETMGAENIEYLSHDYYPFRYSRSYLRGLFADMEVLRSIAYENGKLKTHAFPQSSAWDTARMPSIDEMRWNVYAYLTYGFKALSWFNLVCPGTSDDDSEGFYDSPIYRDGTIRDPALFAAWSELNWEIRGLSSILMNLDAAHAYHTAPIDGVEMLPGNFFLQPVEEEAEFVISVMEPKEGEDQYIMIFNKNDRSEVTASFTAAADSGVKWMEYVDPFTGEYIPVEFEDGGMTEDFRIGEGKLYRLRYDDAPSEIRSFHIILICGVTLMCAILIVTVTCICVKKRQKNKA